MYDTQVSYPFGNDLQVLIARELVVSVITSDKFTQNHTGLLSWSAERFLIISFLHEILLC